MTKEKIIGKFQTSPHQLRSYQSKYFLGFKKEGKGEGGKERKIKGIYKLTDIIAARISWIKKLLTG